MLMSFEKYSNPRASEAKIRKWKSMNCYIYDNPSLPYDIVEDVLFNKAKAQSYIRSVRTNPAFYDCLLENENIEWVNSICSDLSAAVHLPYTDLQWMYKSGKFDYVLVDKICTPTFMLNDIWERNVDLRGIILRHPNADPDKIKEYYSDDWIPKYMLINIAKNPSTPDWILEELADKLDLDIMVEIAKNVKTPSYILDKMYHDNNFNGIGNHIIRNPNAGKDLIRTIYYDKSANLFNFAVPNVPVDIHDKMLESPKGREVIRKYKYASEEKMGDLWYKVYKRGVAIEGTNHIWSRFDRGGKAIYICGCFVGTREILLREIMTGSIGMLNTRLKVLEILDELHESTFGN